MPLDLEQNLILEAHLLTFNILMNPLASFQKRIALLAQPKTSSSLRVLLVRMLLMLQLKIMKPPMAMVVPSLV